MNDSSSIQNNTGLSFIATLCTHVYMIPNSSLPYKAKGEPFFHALLGRCCTIVVPWRSVKDLQRDVFSFTQSYHTTS